MSFNFQKLKFSFFISVLYLTGCNPYLEPVQYPPAMPLNIPPPPKTNGTIYQPGYEANLYQDQVARRIGDILTIRLEEDTRGEYRADTRTDKKASLSYPIPTIFGKDVEALEIQTDTQQKFDGRGDSRQRNRLTGTFTVSVVECLPNQNLVIQGESWITINQGQEQLKIRGIVRPEDIAPDNSVSSQRVAAAMITYGSRGQAGFATRGGVATKLFNRFFPY